MPINSERSAPTTPLAVLKRVTEDTPRPIRQIIPEVPQWLCDLIARLHAKDPAHRFANADEFASYGTFTITREAEEFVEIERSDGFLELICKEWLHDLGVI